MFKNTQKLLNINRDNQMVSGSKNDITGLFKTTSQLSRSIRERNTHEKTTQNNYYYTNHNDPIITNQGKTSFQKTFKDTRPNSMSTSGKMIMTKPPSLKETAIKNLSNISI